MDPLTKARYDALDHYPEADLKRLDYSVIDILIDCQHKGWSGTISSALTSPVTEDGEPWVPENDGDQPPAFVVTLATKDGREHSAFRDIRGCDSLLCRVKEQYAATVECLDVLLPNYRG